MDIITLRKNNWYVIKSTKTKRVKRIFKVINDYFHYYPASISLRPLKLVRYFCYSKTNNDVLISFFSTTWHKDLLWGDEIVEHIEDEHTVSILNEMEKNFDKFYNSSLAKYSFSHYAEIRQKLSAKLLSYYISLKKSLNISI